MADYGPGNTRLAPSRLTGSKERWLTAVCEVDSNQPMLLKIENALTRVHRG
jgi:hypothetical protein